jgi:hypothetical protein
MEIGGVVLDQSACTSSLPKAPMCPTNDSNTRTGLPTAPPHDDQTLVASAHAPDGHYETAPDQVVKVVHQVRPDVLPQQGPTDFETRGPNGPSSADVRVTPEEPSVWDAAPTERPPGG